MLAIHEQFFEVSDEAFVNLLRAPERHSGPDDPGQEAVDPVLVLAPGSSSNRSRL